MKNQNQIRTNQSRSAANPRQADRDLRKSLRAKRRIDGAVELELSRKERVAFTKAAAERGLSLAEFMKRTMRERLPEIEPPNDPRPSEILITENLRGILEEVAQTLGKTAQQVAARAIELYAELAKKNSDLAEAQPTVHFPSAPLFLDADSVNHLVNTASWLMSDPNSVACAALTAYSAIVRGRGTDETVSVENLEYALRRGGFEVTLIGARLAAARAIGRAISQGGKLVDVIAELGAIRDMIMLHPGLREASQALTMMTAGYYQLCDGALGGGALISEAERKLG